MPTLGRRHRQGLLVLPVLLVGQIRFPSLCRLAVHSAVRAAVAVVHLGIPEVHLHLVAEVRVLDAALGTIERDFRTVPALPIPGLPERWRNRP